jgi:cob(I)alamin adenosyltransferase
MKIYTKTGDAGETSLFGGKRVPKHSPRIDAYGTVDELNALLGVVRAFKPISDVDAILETLQQQLFVLGSDLATPVESSTMQAPRIGNDHVQSLETTIDALETRLTPLRSFILPGGAAAGAHVHAARTVCRRAERLVDGLARSENIGSMPLRYLNRLSDLLFVLARFMNSIDGAEEIPWKGNPEPNSRA